MSYILAEKIVGVIVGLDLETGVLVPEIETVTGIAEEVIGAVIEIAIEIEDVQDHVIGRDLAEKIVPVRAIETENVDDLVHEIENVLVVPVPEIVKAVEEEIEEMKTFSLNLNGTPKVTGAVSLSKKNHKITTITVIIPMLNKNLKIITTWSIENQILMVTKTGNINIFLWFE